MVHPLHVCQVGLSALVHVLPDYPNLLPVFAGAPVVGVLGWQGVARQPNKGCSRYVDKHRGSMHRMLNNAAHRVTF